MNKKDCYIYNMGGKIEHHLNENNYEYMTMKISGLNRTEIDLSNEDLLVLKLKFPYLVIYDSKFMFDNGE